MPRPIRRREPANPVQLMSRWEPSCVRRWLRGFKFRRSAVKAGLKPRFGRCKRNTLPNLAAAGRSFAVPISAQAPTIELLSVPLRRQIGRRGFAAD
jgi:hypothetical protein